MTYRQSVIQDLIEFSRREFPRVRLNVRRMKIIAKLADTAVKSNRRHRRRKHIMKQLLLKYVSNDMTTHILNNPFSVIS